MHTNYLETPQEKENKKNSFFTSIALHMLLILLLLMIPLKKAIVQDETLQGIVVDFGNPEGGEMAMEEEPMSAVTAEEQEEEVAEAQKEEETPAPKKEVVKEKAPSLKVETKITQKESPVVASIEKVVDKQAEKVEKKEPSSTSKASAEAKEKAEAERQAEAKRQAESKSKFSSLFDQGSSGEVNEKKGDEFGQPDASVLEGLSKGTGEAGDGLDSRGLIYEPSISDNTQRSGDVVVKVCVNGAGEVTKAKYTQRGSSTTDSYLIKLAETSAKKYRFTKSDAEEQCGTITIHFIVK